MIYCMNVSDLIGFTLGEAKEIIYKSGMEIKDISITAPPKCKIDEIDDSYRVLRSEGDNDRRIKLLVCNPNIRC